MSTNYQIIQIMPATQKTIVVSANNDGEEFRYPLHCWVLVEDMNTTALSYRTIVGAFYCEELNDNLVLTTEFGHDVFEGERFVRYEFA